jgi:hypothetical protein
MRTLEREGGRESEKEKGENEKGREKKEKMNA